MTTTVPATETRIEPMQPRRFEKKKNIAFGPDLELAYFLTPFFRRSHAWCIRRTGRNGLGKTRPLSQ